jgi:hypothetical protein
MCAQSIIQKTIECSIVPNRAHGKAKVGQNGLLRGRLIKPWKIRVRLRLEERIARLEGVAVTRRATRNLLRRLVRGTDQEQILDEAMTQPTLLRPNLCLRRRAHPPGFYPA